MRAHLTFMVVTFVLMALIKLTRAPKLLGNVADDPVVVALGAIAFVLVASALTLLALRLHRGPSPPT